MKSTSRILAIALLALAAGLPALAEKTVAQTFTGTCNWKQGGKDELSAEFTPKNSWKVKLRSCWDGESRNWQGTA